MLLSKRADLFLMAALQLALVLHKVLSQSSPFRLILLWLSSKPLILLHHLTVLLSQQCYLSLPFLSPLFLLISHLLCSKSRLLLFLEVTLFPGVFFLLYVWFLPIEIINISVFLLQLLLQAIFIVAQVCLLRFYLLEPICSLISFLVDLSLQGSCYLR